MKPESLKQPMVFYALSPLERFPPALLGTQLLQPPGPLALPLSRHQASFWGLCTCCPFWLDSSSPFRWETPPLPLPKAWLFSENLIGAPVPVPLPRLFVIVCI